MTKVFVQFCDDVRQEIGGKTTLVGLYQEVIITDEMPCILPKFCVYLTMISKDADLSIPIEINSDGDILFSGGGTFKIQKDEWFGVDVERRASLPLMFSPIILQKEGIFTVRAKINGKWVIAGQIAVQKAKAKTAGVAKKTVPTKRKKSKK